jgi:hypothetical protein
MRVLWMGLEDAAVASGVMVRPQTTHFVAFSLRRDPQVGQTFVCEAGV